MFILFNANNSRSFPDSCLLDSKRIYIIYIYIICERKSTKWAKSHNSNGWLWSKLIDLFFYYDSWTAIQIMSWKADFPNYKLWDLSTLNSKHNKYKLTGMLKHIFSRCTSYVKVCCYSRITLKIIIKISWLSY